MIQFLIFKRFKNAIFLLVVILVLLPIFAFAAQLYLEPAESQCYQGDVFIQEIRINTEGEYINTVKVELSFPQEILEVKDFSKGNSILTLWAKEPSFSNKEGSISFIGGIPAGYQGWDGLLGRIIFETKHQSSKVAEVKFLDSSQVLLNNGLGTSAKLTFKRAILTVLAEVAPEPPRDEWQQELQQDTIRPELFEIQLRQDPSVFEGKYFIIFSTTDKQTGIDYYAISEARAGQKEVWKVADTSYLLEDQKLKSIIKVKAVDKAGNERLAEIIPFKIPPKKPFPYWTIILILAAAALLWWTIRKLKMKK